MSTGSTAVAGMMVSKSALRGQLWRWRRVCYRPTHGLRQSVDRLRQLENLSRDHQQVFILLFLSLNCLPLLIGEQLALMSARFWLIITNVDRNIASNDTIIVSKPYGYASRRKMIHAANQIRCK